MKPHNIFALSSNRGKYMCPSSYFAGIIENRNVCICGYCPTQNLFYKNAFVQISQVLKTHAYFALIKGHLYL